MKEIKLTHGKIALVDDEDYEYLNQWKWHIRSFPNLYYAIKSLWINGKTEKIFMHRLIMNTPKGMEVDHIDHNGLNNQKSNLRNCTHKQNIMNGRFNKSKTGYRGVSYSSINRFKVSIMFNQKDIHIGVFKDKEDAARAYDKKAKELFGEFANLNFKE